MEGSSEDEVVDTGALTPAVRNVDSADELKGAVEGRLARWDSDRAEAEALGYNFDPHDLRTALYGLFISTYVLIVIHVQLY